MEINVDKSKAEMARAAAAFGADLIRRAVRDNGGANVVVATGASQIEMLTALASEPDIPWNLVECFHLDEYIGMPLTHPASFRRFLWERFASRLPMPLKSFQWINGEGDAFAECRRLSTAIENHPIDVAFIGIGENGHLAFNDPPADFDVEDPYIVVTLDEACRRQQLGEGWFPNFESVPRQAISMSIRQIMKCGQIVCTVPDERKSAAVRNAIEGPVSPSTPASILQNHAQASLFLDAAAASQLAQGRL